LTSCVVPADSVRAFKIVLKSIESLFGKGHVLWVTSFYGLLGLGHLIKKNGVIVAGTVNSEFMLVVGKETTLKRVNTLLCSAKE
jgi:hypothetical protein